MRGRRDGGWLTFLSRRQTVRQQSENGKPADRPRSKCSHEGLRRSGVRRSDLGHSRANFSTGRVVERCGAYCDMATSTRQIRTLMCDRSRCQSGRLCRGLIGVKLPRRFSHRARVIVVFCIQGAFRAAVNQGNRRAIKWRNSGMLRVVSVMILAFIAATSLPAAAQSSGFRQDYSKLHPDPDQPGVLSYRKNRSKVIFDTNFR